MRNVAGRRIEPPPQRLALEGERLDLIEIDAATHTGVDDVQIRAQAAGWREGTASF